MATAGYAVFSNASAHRMDADVPLLIPEVNADHLRLVAAQRAARGWEKGCIITNPNCATIGLALALKPLHDAFGVRRVLVTTMQAISGAGYPGVPTLDSLDNVIPYIGGEEDKLSTEPLKLLGTLAEDGRGITPAAIAISAACNRVSTRDGHLATVSLEFAQEATPEQVIAALRAFPSRPHQLGCPSAVQPVIVVRDEVDRPQTFLDRDAGRGMTVTVGRVRRCAVLHTKFVLLAHNTIRGAAGGAILNAELAIAEGLIR